MKNDIHKLEGHSVKSTDRRSYKNEVLKNVKMVRDARKEIIKGFEKGLF